VNAEDAVKLCRYVKACCPQQAIDELTPLAWADHLEHVSYDDAKAAAKEITAKQPFVTIAEVLTIVKRIRASRIEDHPPLTPPPDLDPIETLAWLKDARRRIADGEVIDCDQAYGELRPRVLSDLKQLMPATVEQETP
jgi:hypothetical protein